MRLYENLRMALRSLMTRKMRTFLTMLGIIIGTGAVIALISVGSGASAEITSSITEMGSNLIFIIPGNYNVSAQQMTNRPQNTLTLKDAEAIADPSQISNIVGVAPQTTVGVTATYGQQTVTLQLVGSSQDYALVNNLQVLYGSFFSQMAVDVAARVVVLGYDTATTLFGDASLAVGQKVRINKLPFTVEGVLAPRGGYGVYGTRDNVMIAPITTVMRRFQSDRFGPGESNRVSMVLVSVDRPENIDNVSSQIIELLRARHKLRPDEENDFTITSQKDILSSLTQVTSILTIFLGAIAGISLLVGGIGIMNIMLVSVTERTREIGIRKAVGAKRSDIMEQFLIESVVLSVSGGLVGILVGWLLSLFVNRIAQGAFTTVITPSSVLLAVGFSLIVGLFFGIYPARRAANLNPIDALRYE